MNNRNLKFLNFNIETEKKRILWRPNQLYSVDNVEYHPRIEVEQTQIPSRQIHALPSTSQSTPRISTNTVASPRGDQVLLLTKRCYSGHKGMGCASFNSGHLPEYYNSGQFGDRTCEHCNNKLHSEKCLSYTNGRVRLNPLK